jgi:hypothetical protein
MTRRAKRKAASPEVHNAWVLLFTELFVNLMKGLLKSHDVEERYVPLQGRVRKSTEDEIQVLARRAAEYWVEHGGCRTSSTEDRDRLKKAAFDSALSQ